MQAYRTLLKDLGKQSLIGVKGAEQFNKKQWVNNQKALAVGTEYTAPSHFAMQSFNNMVNLRAQFGKTTRTNIIYRVIEKEMGDLWSHVFPLLDMNAIIFASQTYNNLRACVFEWILDNNYAMTPKDYRDFNQLFYEIKQSIINQYTNNIENNAIQTWERPSFG